MSKHRALSYIHAGPKDAATILFLHGFMGSRGDWDEVMGTLSSQFFCLALDLPGHGQSLDLNNPFSYTLPGAAEAVCYTLQGLKIATCVLAGYSMGGRLALYLAVHYPQRWSGIVLESTTPGIRDVGKRKERIRQDKAQAQQLRHKPFRDFLVDWYDQSLFQTLKRDPRLLAKMMAARARNEPKELAKALRGMSVGRQEPLWSALPQISQPLLAIVGELDEKYVEVAKEMTSLNKRLRITMVSGVGHNVHWEHPTAFACTVKSFVHGHIKT